MFDDITDASFDLIWQLQNEPTLDITEHQVDNDPLSVQSLHTISPDVPVQSDVPCLYSGGSTVGSPESDTTPSDMSFFVKNASLTAKLTHAQIITFNGRKYKLNPGGIIDIGYGITELSTMRGD